MIYFLAFYGFCIAIAGLEFWLVTRPDETEPDFSDWTLIPQIKTERPRNARRLKRQSPVVEMSKQAASANDGLALEEHV
ncbi:MAG: hypothetical protein AAF497_27000 [Planctomycetota bacterium]